MAKLKVLEKRFFRKLGKDLSKPINPYLISLLGLFSIIYSFYLYVPKQNVSKNYSILIDQNIREIMFVGAIGLGVWLFSVPSWAKSIDRMILPLRIMSGYWIATAIVVAMVNWTSQGIIVYIFLSAFCLISAANYSINKNEEFYEDIFS